MKKTFKKQIALITSAYMLLGPAIFGGVITNAEEFETEEPTVITEFSEETPSENEESVIEKDTSAQIEISNTEDFETSEIPELPEITEEITTSEETVEDITITEDATNTEILEEKEVPEETKEPIDVVSDKEDTAIEGTVIEDTDSTTVTYTIVTTDYDDLLNKYNEIYDEIEIAKPELNHIYELYYPYSEEEINDEEIRKEIMRAAELHQFIQAKKQELAEIQTQIDNYKIDDYTVIVTKEEYEKFDGTKNIVTEQINENTTNAVTIENANVNEDKREEE